MKKANIAIDFVLFGDLEDDETQKKLEAFNEQLKANEGSHMVVIPPSSKLLSDQLISTPILLGESAAGGSGMGGDGVFGGDLEFEDPELALALRMSMEEEKARQEKIAREQEQAAQKASLETVKEESETTPLIDHGESSKQNDKDNKSGNGDKMDTS